jgi:hypothetical protein
MRLSFLPNKDKLYKPKSKKRIKYIVENKSTYNKTLDLNKVDFIVSYNEEINRIGNSSGDTFLYQEISYNGKYEDTF